MVRAAGGDYIFEGGLPHFKVQVNNKDKLLMSEALINKYYNQLDRAIHYSKSTNEDTIKSYFWMLMNDYAHKHNYEVVREVYCQGTKGRKVKPDGILKNLWGLDVGYWESKDEKDNIEDEIDAKIKKGYPTSNILYEDSGTAILFQYGEEVMRINMRESKDLNEILTKFISFKNAAVVQFEDAIEKFKEDIPHIVETLRNRIAEAREKNEVYIKERGNFLKLCQAEINPDITLDDIREMMIQHIVTSDIFNKIFDDPEFHSHNTIAAELEKLIATLFKYAERRNLLVSIEHYYETINAAAAGIVDHHEKQKFLKVLYENFYKVYNPKAADRLGVVYTPNEIVKFMIESTDHLLHHHFDKTLSDKNVDILDPATGTGTFISDIIEYIPKQYLAKKYKDELHANEVSILPYYIANLNIEYTYKQKMGYFAEFENICFVDTLDNVQALEGGFGEHKITYQTTGDMFALTSENSERIKRQNAKKISVIIGNPPYNANQKNENENNKNRAYPVIDKRIKKTFIEHSTAQKTKTYDMYSRFYRWAMDRVDNNGIISFITNRSFIDKRTFDGFRKCVQDDFSHAYIIDTKSDVRDNPKIAGTTHNVFGIQTGVAIMFLIKKEQYAEKCKIYYVSMEDEWRKEEKLEWLRNKSFEQIQFTPISPDKKHNWINIADNDWDDLLPLCDKDVKAGKMREGAVFQLFTLGTVSNRDDWVYDFNLKKLKDKIVFFIKNYGTDLGSLDKERQDTIVASSPIKYTRDLKKKLHKRSVLHINNSEFRSCLYRPFTMKNLYFDSALNEMRYQTPLLFPNNKSDNKLLAVNVSDKPFNILASKDLVDLHFNGDSQCLPLYRYDSDGNRNDNITDWGLRQFKEHYGREQIKREDVFHYVYGVLHNPAYRKKYELNLKRELPRVPFYADFTAWVERGKTLMALHLDYESITPYPLKVVNCEIEVKKKTDEMFSEKEPQSLFAREPSIKVKLKADKEKGVIFIDTITTISGIPKTAWEYRLGNRSAIEWVLDQYKEKKIKDATVAEKFNTYHFADYKDEVIDLLKRVCAISVQTMEIVDTMGESST